MIKDPQFRFESILTMCEELRYYIMRKMAGHKIVLGTYIGKTTPVYQKRLAKQEVESNK